MVLLPNNTLLLLGQISSEMVKEWEVFFYYVLNLDDRGLAQQENILALQVLALQPTDT